MLPTAAASLTAAATALSRPIQILGRRPIEVTRRSAVVAAAASAAVVAPRGSRLPPMYSTPILVLKMAALQLLQIISTVPTASSTRRVRRSRQAALTGIATWTNLH